MTSKAKRCVCIVLIPTQDIDVGMPALYFLGGRWIVFESNHWMWLRAILVQQVVAGRQEVPKLGVLQVNWAT